MSVLGLLQALADAVPVGERAGRGDAIMALPNMDVQAERHREAEELVELRRGAEAQLIYEALLARDANDARAAFQVGRILLERGDLDGIKHLRHAMEIEWSLGVPACALIESTLRAMRRHEVADLWAQRHQQQLELQKRVMAERSQLTVTDDLVPTELPPEVQEAILARCREAGWVAEVWIVRKNLTDAPVSADFVAVVPRMLAFAGHGRLQKLADAIANAIGLEISVCRIYDDRSILRRLDGLGARRRLPMKR